VIFVRRSIFTALHQITPCETQITTIQLLDVVTLTVDLPAQALLRGQVGTVVESLAPGVFEVEFSADEGRTYAQLPLNEGQLLVLHYHPQRAA
jgi:hypothetical protein